MSIAVVGNGSIAMFAASRLLLDHPGCPITIFGPSSRPFSASNAAGLMLNIFSEIDCISRNLPLTQWKLNNSKLALDAWLDFFGPSGVVSDSVFTSSLTDVILPNESTNALERRSFDSQSSISAAYGASSISTSSLTRLPNEPSADARHVLRELDGFLFEKVIHVPELVHSVHHANSNYVVRTNDCAEHGPFSTVLIASGSKTSEILQNSSDSLRQPNIHCFNGVGSALHVSSELNYVDLPQSDRILRTPNRGGTCGLHLVPNVDSLYVGASSVVTFEDLKYPRLGSVQTLLNGAMSELSLPDLTRLSIDILTGYRPVTQDAYPLFGELDQGCYVAYGHKRDGFTWAPYLSSIISDLIASQPLSPQASHYLELCDPHRNFRSFGSFEESLALYLLNEEYSAAQHSGVQQQSRDTLESRFYDAHKSLASDNTVIHPELVNVNYHYSKAVAQKR